jgi:hypothetical protein
VPGVAVGQLPGGSGARTNDTQAEITALA